MSCYAADAWGSLWMQTKENISISNNLFWGQLSIECFFTNDRSEQYLTIDKNQLSISHRNWRSHKAYQQQQRLFQCHNSSISKTHTKNKYENTSKSSDIIVTRRRVITDNNHHSSMNHKHYDKLASERWQVQPVRPLLLQSSCCCLRCCCCCLSFCCGHYCCCQCYFSRWCCCCYCFFCCSMFVAPAFSCVWC